MQVIDELMSVWEQRREAGAPVSPEELCRDCPELLAEVRWQIRALEAVDSRFGPTSGVESTFSEAAQPRRQVEIGDELELGGRLRIENHHASGGLGDVFVAVDPVLNRRVAVKFPRARRMTAAHRVRFEREARVTGRLDHPGIVAVHAVRLESDEPPCFVMRFVEGQTLHERVGALHRVPAGARPGSLFQSLEFRQLLQQFIALCNTVAYAHGQGVIHRDIKPGNVILGPFGETLLLDWGLAKVADEADPEQEGKSGTALSGAISTTRSGDVLGTPAFASPEQLLGQPERVDRRSDVFSLGATLYFILTGKLPLEAGGLSGHLDRISRTATSTLEVGKPVPAALAAICRAATSVAPDLRYPAALDLAADVQRHLAGEPVSVLRESWPVRAQRWLRGHPRTAVGSAVALSLLAVFAAIASALTAGFNRQLGQANQELRASNTKLETASGAEQQARQRAEANFETAHAAVDQFLVSVTDHPRLNSDDFTGLQSELLDSARPFYEALLAQQPGDNNVEYARADAWHRLAQIDRVTGKVDAAKEGYRAALEIAGQLVEREPDNLEFRDSLATCLDNQGLLFRQTGDLAAARQSHERALEVLAPLIAVASPSPEHVVTTAGAHNNLALVLGDLGERELARRHLEQAIALRQPLIDDGNAEPRIRRDQAIGCNNLGSLLANGSEFDAARKLYGSGVKLADQLAAEFPEVPDYRDVQADLGNNLGLLLRSVGELEAACEQLEKAASIWSGLADRFPSEAGYRHDLANCRNNLGVARSDLGDNATARADYTAAIETWRELAAENPDQPAFRNRMALALNNLGSLENQLGERDAALQHLTESLAIREEFMNRFPDDPFHGIGFGGAACNLAGIIAAADPADSLKLYDQAAAALEKFLDDQPGHPTGVQFLRNIWAGRALALESLARYAEAADFWQRAADLVDGPDKESLEAEAAKCRAQADGAGSPDEITDGKREPSKVD